MAAPHVALLVAFWSNEEAVVRLCSPDAMTISNCGYCRFNHMALNKAGAYVFIFNIPRLSCCMTTSASQMEFYYGARTTCFQVNFEKILGALLASSGVFKAGKNLGKLENLSPVAVLAGSIGFLGRVHPFYFQ